MYVLHTWYWWFPCWWYNWNIKTFCTCLWKVISNIKLNVKKKNRIAFVYLFRQLTFCSLANVRLVRIAVCGTPHTSVWLDFHTATKITGHLGFPVCVIYNQIINPHPFSCNTQIHTHQMMLLRSFWVLFVWMKYISNPYDCGACQSRMILFHPAWSQYFD